MALEVWGQTVYAYQNLVPYFMKRQFSLAFVIAVFSFSLAAISK